MNQETTISAVSMCMFLALIQFSSFLLKVLVFQVNMSVSEPYRKIIICKNLE